MQGERTPPFPADAGNAIELAAFCNNVKERTKWLEGVKKLIEKNEKLLASIGKATQIDKLHSEALELREKVLTEIERREQKLEQGRRELDRDIKTQKGALAHERQITQERLRDMEQRTSKSLKTAEQKEKAAREAWAAAKDAQQKAEKDRDQVRALREELRQKSDEAAALAKKLSA